MYIISPREYVSSVLVSTEDGSSELGANLGGLASLAGIDVSQSQGLNVLYYESILQSTPLLLEVVNHKVLFGKDSIYLKDYLNNYMVLSFSQKLSALTGKAAAMTHSDDTSSKSSQIERYLSIQRADILRMSKYERSAVGVLRQRIAFWIEKEKPFRLEVRLQDPFVSAQVAQLGISKLSEYLTKHKVGKSGENVRFAEEELLKARKKLIQKQAALANLRDQNRNLISAAPTAAIDRLSMEYQLAYNVYNSIAMKLENAKIQVEDEKPVFIVIEPPFPMDIKSPAEPRFLLYIILSFLLGFVLSVITIWYKEFFRKD